MQLSEFAIDLLISLFAGLFFRCDAEPVALAKYVCALLKKNKPEQDLRDICVDQLDVFLQQSKHIYIMRK